MALSLDLHERLRHILDTTPHSAVPRKVASDIELLSYINTQTDGKSYSSLSEQIWLTLNPDFKQVCERGNYRKFLKLKDGYGFCGTPKVCECAREHRSQATKAARRNTNAYSAIDYNYLDAPQDILDELHAMASVGDRALSRRLESSPKLNNLVRTVKDMHGIKKLPEAIYLCVNRMLPPTCDCGNRVSFASYAIGYRTFCSTFCETRRKAQSESVARYHSELSDDDRAGLIAKQKQAMLDKYGVDNPMRVEEIRKQIERTNLERYGSKAPLASPIVREKIKGTMLSKYGVETPFEDPTIRMKARETFFNNNPDARDQMVLAREKLYEQYDGNPFSSAEIKNTIKQTMLDRYGVAHPSQSPELVAKRSQKFYDKYKRYDYNPLYISNESWEVLTTKGLFGPMYEELGVLSMAKKLGVGEGSIYKWAREHGFAIRSRSSSEDAVRAYVESLGVEVKANDRTICKSYNGEPHEIDIVVPGKLCIEYCGLYWHSEANGKFNNYHLNKTRACDAAGMQLFTIFEDEWLDRPDVVKHKIKSALGLVEASSGARDITVREITHGESSPFLEKYHLQGSTKAQVHIGGYLGDKLVAVMTFGSPFSTVEDSKLLWDMKRFACDFGRYPGVAGKLLTFFEDAYKPLAILSYADRRWSSGNVYHKLGFELTSMVPPSYWYIVRGERKHRSNFTKRNLIKRYGFKEPFTEAEAMRQLGYDRIWDCGNLRFEKWYR